MHEDPAAESTEISSAGEIFAAGHAESGNDIPVLLSTSKAERVEGGYRFTGRKQLRYDPRFIRFRFLTRLRRKAMASSAVANGPW